MEFLLKAFVIRYEQFGMYYIKDENEFKLKGNSEFETVCGKFLDMDNAIRLNGSRESFETLNKIGAHILHAKV